MKKLLLIAALMAVVSVAAQQPYCMSKLGTTAEYVSYDDSGQVDSYSTNTVISVSGDSAKYTVKQHITMLDSRKRPVKGGEYVSESYFDNGVTRLGVNQVAKLFGAKVRLSGVAVELPTQVDALTHFKPCTLDCYINFAGIRFTADAVASGYKYLGRENISVGGRSFDCVKISYRTATEVAGKSYPTSVVEWIARGVGIVKVEIYNSKGKLNGTTQLVCLK